MMRTLRWGLLLGLFGCELVVDFDRSRIPEAGVDAGTTDAGGRDGGLDAGGEDAGGEDGGPEDGGTDDGGTDDGGPDDGGTDDGGTDAGIDAGTDAGMDGGTDAGVECTMPSECDDSITCTTNACTGNACVYTPVDAMCDDTDACTADSCSATTGCVNDVICGVSTPATLVVDDLSTIVVIPSAEAASAGHLVVYTDDAGSPSTTSIGSAAIAAGMHTNVTIELSRPVVDAEILHVRLHLDDGDGTFEGAGTDVPAMLMGAEVRDSFEVDLVAGTPDLELRITSGNGTDYVFGAGRPTTFASDLATGNDPALTLVRGFRYRIVNASTSGHPLAFVAAADVQQLSQSSAGALEADTDIAWVESGNDVEFSVVAALEVATAYLCTNHPSEMRGTIAYVD
ncbi:MAG: hypothetical protein H6721_26845 [Sandaracinus sp.]|nr:hypothetical protein [Sandaracinus sp.]MCB9635753.1 hypothetical protein [Sandaracinus sp.]